MRTLTPSRTRALHERLNEASLPETCVIQEQAQVSVGDTTQTTWPPVGDPLPCRVSPVGSSKEKVLADQVQAFAQYLVTFARATVIPLDTRLSVTMGEETLLLDPQGHNGPRSWEAQRKYLCRVWTG